MIRITRCRGNQRGMSTPSWIAVAGIFGFLLITFFRVFPMYYDHFKVTTVMESLQQDQKIDPKSKRAIWASMHKRLAIQDVESIKRENVKISRKNGKTTVVVSYEVKVDYIANLFIGGRFVETIVIDR